MIALLAMVAMSTNVAEFFPLNPGDSWEYVTEGAGGAMRVVNRVQPKRPVGDHEAYPMQMILNGQVMGTTYYMVKDNSVYVVAFDIKRPFFEPRRMLTVEEKTVKWDYQLEEDLMPVSVSNQATLRGKRKVLDREVDILELKVEAILGDPKGVHEKLNQTFLYGRGLGMVEMQEERRVNKNSFKRKMKLAKFTPAASEGSGRP
ncbi:MAG: hypothetical protein IT363_07740 [Methanoregulaceae archaeon]|jgi:hypothetical protein|nr:hypothetical protein [Methanoregulaceae archaeon]